MNTPELKNKCMQVVGKNDEGKLLSCGRPCMAICCDTCQAASIVEWEVLRLNMRRDHKEWGSLTLSMIRDMTGIATARDFLNHARAKNAPNTRIAASKCITAGQCGDPDPSYFIKGVARAQAMAQHMSDRINPFWLGMSDEQIKAFRRAQESRATRTVKRTDDGGAMVDPVEWNGKEKAKAENFSNV